MKCHSKWGWFVVACGLSGVGMPSPASACGGFFCNREAVDQSGENIIFAHNEDGTVTTIVQILYQGPSEQFAWILPVPAEPTVSVGTDALFQGLNAQTRPRFTLDYAVNGTCRNEPSCGGRGYDDGAEFAGGGPTADAGSAPPSAEDEVDVRFRGNVGPFDAAVLAAGSGDVLRQWLTDNDYLIPEAAGGELDYYVDLDHFFVALRLQKNREAGEIQPIVLTSSNPEPCIPIRLTRIATVPDMPVTAYFLADRRARPLNYMLVEPDLEDVGLWTGTTSYSAVVTRAVDDAGGQAFVTDYSGDVPVLALELSSIEDLRELDDPVAFLQALQSRGFTGDSQLMAILETYIPPADDYDSQTFYNCLIQEWCVAELRGYLDELLFSPNSLVEALNEAIVEPRAEAQRLLEAHTTLSRLFTTLSADEMTLDPMFVLSDTLDREFSNQHVATQTTECGPEYFYWSAPLTLTLPSGATQTIREGVPYYGTDDEYCRDRYEGDFYPGAPMEQLREVSDASSVRPGGGTALCSVDWSPTRFGLAWLLGAALGIGLLARRRGRH